MGLELNDKCTPVLKVFLVVTEGGGMGRRQPRLHEKNQVEKVLGVLGISGWS